MPETTRGGGRAGRALRATGLVFSWALVLALGGCGDEGAGVGARALDVTVSWGEVGIQPGQLNYPRAICADGDAVWVVDKAAQVQRFDARTGRLTGGWRLTDFAFGKPTGITSYRLGARDLLLIPETHYHRVSVYEIPAGYGVGDGEPPMIARFGSFGRDGGQFTFPTDVAVEPTADGAGIARLYVSEYGGNDRISIFRAVDPSRPEAGFAFEMSFGRFGASASAETVEFSRPQSLEFDAARRELVVTDACNHRIGRFTPEGGLIAWIGSPETAGEGLGEFLYPYGLVLLGDGTALVSEFQGARVQRVDLLTGAGLAVYGRRGRGAGELASPWGVAAAGGTVYVLDSGNSRVLGFAVPSRAGAREDRLARGAGAGKGGPG